MQTATAMSAPSAGTGAGAGVPFRSIFIGPPPSAADAQAAAAAAQAPQYHGSITLPQLPLLPTVTVSSAQLSAAAAAGVPVTGVSALSGHSVSFAYPAAAAAGSSGAVAFQSPSRAAGGAVADGSATARTRGRTANRVISVGAAVTASPGAPVPPAPSTAGMFTALLRGTAGTSQVAAGSSSSGSGFLPNLTAAGSSAAAASAAANDVKESAAADVKVSPAKAPRRPKPKSQSALIAATPAGDSAGEGDSPVPLATVVAAAAAEQQQPPQSPTAAAAGPVPLAAHPQFAGLVAAANASTTSLLHLPPTPPPAPNPFAAGVVLSPDPSATVDAALADDASNGPALAADALAVAKAYGIGAAHPVAKKLASQAVHTSHLMSGNAKLHRENKKLRAAQQLWAAQLQHLQTENQRLMGVCQSQSALSLELHVLRRNANSHKDAEFDALAADNVALQHKHKALTELLLVVHTERDKLQQQLKAAEEKGVELATKVVDLKAGHDRYRKLLAAANKKHDKAMDAHKRLTHEHAVVVAEQQATAQEVARLRHQNATQRDTIRESATKLDALQLTVREQRTRIDALTAESANKTDDLHARAHRLQTITADHELVRRANAELTAARDAAAAEILRLSNEQSRRQTEVDTLTAVNGHLQKLKDQLQAESDAWAERHRELTARTDEHIAILNLRCSDAERRAQETATELARTAERLNAANVEVNGCRAAIQEWRVANDALKAEGDKAQAKAARLEAELKRTETALLEEKSAAAKAAKDAEGIRRRLKDSDAELSDWKGRKDASDKALAEEKRSHEVTQNRLSIRGGQLLELQRSIRDRDNAHTELERKLAAATEKHASAALVAHRKQQELSQLEGVIRDVNQAADRARDDAKRAEYEADEIRRAHSQCAGYAAQLTDARARIDALNAEIVSKTQEIARVNADWALKLADHAHCDRDKGDLNKRLGAVSERLTAMEAAHAKLNTQYHELERQHAPCSVTISNLQNNWSATQSSLEVTEVERAKLKAELTDARSTAAAAHKQLELHRMVISELDGDKKRFERELSQRVLDGEAAAERHRALDQDLKDLQLKHDALLKEHAALKHNSAESVAEGTSLYALRLRLSALEADLATAKRATAAAEGMSNTLQSEVQRLHTTESAIIADRDALAAKHDALYREHSSVCSAREQKFERLMTDHTALQQQLADVQSQLSVVQTAHTTLQQTHDKCVAGDALISQLRKELDGARLQLVAWTQSHESETHARENAQAAQAVSAATAELNTLTATHAALTKAHATTTAALAEAESQLRAKTTALATYERLTAAVPGLHADKARAVEQYEAERSAHERTRAKLQEVESAHMRCSGLAVATEQLRRETALAKSTAAAAAEIVAKLTAPTPSASAIAAAAATAEQGLTRDQLSEALRLANAEVSRLSVEAQGALSGRHAVSAQADALRAQLSHAQAAYDGVMKEQRRREQLCADAAARFRALKPQLGVVCATAAGVAGGVVITDVRPGQAAAEAGLQRGDVVEFVGATPTRLQADLFKAVEGVSPGDRLTFHVLRGTGLAAAAGSTVPPTPTAAGAAGAGGSPAPPPPLVTGPPRRVVCVLEVGAAGYTRQQIAALRRLSQRSDADFDVSLTPALLLPTGAGVGSPAPAPHLAAPATPSAAAASSALSSPRAAAAGAGAAAAAPPSGLSALNAAAAANVAAVTALSPRASRRATAPAPAPVAAVLSPRAAAARR